MLCQVSPHLTRISLALWYCSRAARALRRCGDTPGRFKEWGAICPQPGLLGHSAQPSHGTQNPRALVLWCAVSQLRNGLTILSAGKVRKREQIWPNLVFARYSEVSSSYIARQTIAYSGSDAVSSSRALAPCEAACSHLLKKAAGSRIAFMDNLRGKLEYKKKRTP